MADNPAVDKYLAQYKDMQAEKAPWNVHFQRLAEAFLTREQNFTSNLAPGAFLYSDIYDNTGEWAAMQAASVFLAMLWPDSSRTFRLKPVDELKDEPGVEKYFQWCTRQAQRFMDNPRAGFLLALQEHLIEQQVFGTSGIGTFAGDDDPSVPVVYDAWGAKALYISENAQGFVDMVYTADMKTVRQIVELYGDKNVHPRVMELFRQGKYEDKVELLVARQPRKLADRDPKKGAAGMAFSSCHIDVTNKHLMKESGYEEFPIAVGRMLKTIGEKNGRSPAMTALPDSNSLNALKESIMVASEKQLDPPLGVLDDGRLGGGVIDTSAGALNVFNSAGRLTGDKPVFPLFTVGELQSAKEEAEGFKESIMQAFGLDRLLDLNNQTQMTAFETSVRNRMRGEALGAMFSRQIVEVLTPTIERTFNILYRKGLLGTQETGAFATVKKLWSKVLGKPVMEIPPSVLAAIDAGLDVYEVEYISPAKRFMQSEKLQGIFTAAEFITKVAVVPGMETIADNIDVDGMARDVIQYSGAPDGMLRLKDDVKAIREGRQAAQEQQAKLAGIQQAAEAARNVGQAAQSFGGAGGMGAGGQR